MKNVLQSTLFVLISILFLSACEKDDGNLNNKINQTEVSKTYNNNGTLKNQLTKDDYMELNFSEQKTLWTDKLNQIKTENISVAQETQIDIILNAISIANNRETLVSNNNLEDAAYEMLRLTSDQDFLLMFNTLDAYSVNNPISYRDDIETSSAIFSKLEGDFNQGDIEEGDGALKKCNCNWTCGGSGSSCTHSDCEETSSGCGFLWMFSCGERDELYPQNCANVGS